MVKAPADKPAPAPATPEVSVQAAVEVLRAGLRTFRAFEQAEAALAALANLDQVAHERKAAADAAQAEFDTVTAALAKLKEQHAAEDAAGKEAASAARKAATDVVRKAEARADALVGKANTELATLSTEKSNVEAKLADLRRQVQAMEKRLAELAPVVERAERIAAAAV